MTTMAPVNNTQGRRRKGLSGRDSRTFMSLRLLPTPPTSNSVGPQRMGPVSRRCVRRDTGTTGMLTASTAASTAANVTGMRGECEAECDGELSSRSWAGFTRATLREPSMTLR